MQGAPILHGQSRRGILFSEFLVGPSSGILSAGSHPEDSKPPSGHTLNMCKSLIDVLCESTNFMMMLRYVTVYIYIYIHV